MRNIIAICRKELFSFFVSPVAYFCITGFVLLAAYFFFNLLGSFNKMLASYAAVAQLDTLHSPNLNQWVVQPYYQTLTVIIVFIVPLLTMRVLAEEKHGGTFELLITSPVKVSEIVIGKFLALAIVVSLMLLGSFAFPLLLCVYGNPEVLIIISGQVGLVFYGLAFVSIGMAVSSLSENQVVSAVSSVVVLLLLYVIHAPADSLTGGASQVFLYLSPIMQLRDMLKGVFSVVFVTYFISLILIGLFLTQRVLEAQRWR